MIGNIHKIYEQTPSESYLLSQLFLSHMAQISIIATWASGNLYHIAWQSNYSYWQSNPSRIIPIAHNIWDPNYGIYSSDVFSAGYTDVSAISSTAGIHHWLYTVGVRDESDIFLISIVLSLSSILILAVALIHTKISESQILSAQGSIGIAYTSPGYRLNYHIGILLGLSSVLWAGHIVHVAIPYSRSGTHEARLTEMVTGNWIAYSQNIDSQAHIHGCS